MTEPITFESFGLDPRIMAAITAMGYKTPTPIQSQAIPVVLAGGDVMGAAQTGTGKTAGYGLPSLQRIISKANSSASPARHPVRVLILAPTRELAVQVNDNLKAYASQTPLRVSVVYGGVDIKPQELELRRGVEVLTATPGRLLDHIQAKTVSLSQVEVVILDEADRMLDMGFLPDITRILNLLPKQRQSLMFSATFSPEIKKLAKSYLQHPKIIEVARENATADTVRQVVYSVKDEDKTDALIEILKTGGEDKGPLKQVLVFVNAKITCRRLERILVSAGIAAGAIHGDKTQDERSAALNAFKDGSIHVLVATDVAARGLDIAELPVVINYDVPFSPEDYVHRIGRTGRAGAKGLAIMLCGSRDERLVEGIEKLTKQKFTVEKYEPAPRAFRERRRAPRRDRDTSWRDNDREGRVPPRAAPRHSVAYDPIFDQPYESGKAVAAARPKEAPLPASLQGYAAPKKKRVVSALLGGTRK